MFLHQPKYQRSLSCMCLKREKFNIQIRSGHKWSFQRKKNLIEFTSPNTYKTYT